MKKRLIIILLAAGAAFSVRTQAQTQTQAPFGDGELLCYAVSYRAKLIPNINVMRVTLRTATEEIGGRPHYHIVGNGRTGGVVKGFFNLNDTYHSWLDSETLLPLRMTSDIQEDNHRFKATFNYDWGAMQVNNVLRNARWDANEYHTIPLQDNSGDALSLLYRLRGVDVDALEPGKRYPLDLILDRTSKTIFYTFLGREQIKVKKLGTFDALRIKCTMVTSDGTTFEDGMELTAWISDDDNRIPLVIDSPIRVGSVRVTLTEMQIMNH